MNLNQFQDKKILIMGLGLHGGGVGAAIFFSHQKAKVTVTDLRSEADLKKSLEELADYPINYVLGQHRPEDFKQADLIIKNPAIPDDSPFLKIAQDNEIPIETDVSLFFQICPRPIIGITGTKGKSTTASLTAEFLKKKYEQVVLAGNIGQSVLASLAQITKDSLVVLELSSWQLAGLAKTQLSPPTALITNILNDHLNRYLNKQAYINDKELIWRWQKPTDQLVLNYDNQFTREMAQRAQAQTLFFSSQDLSQIPLAQQGAYLKNKKIFFKKEEIIDQAAIKLSGEHNLSNILGAISLAKLYQVDNSFISQTLASFKGIPWRLELVGLIKGVKFINDTTATMPEACQMALKSFSDYKIILIAGGADKALEFSDLSQDIVQKTKAVILLPGTATPKLKEAIIKAGGQALIRLEAESMNQAVQKAFSLSQPGEVVLLSPACASFGLFKHEFDRGQQFNLAVKKL